MTIVERRSAFYAWREGVKVEMIMMPHTHLKFILGETLLKFTSTPTKWKRKDTKRQQIHHREVKIYSVCRRRKEQVEVNFHAWIAKVIEMKFSSFFLFSFVICGVRQEKKRRDTRWTQRDGKNIEFKWENDGWESRFTSSQSLTHSMIAPFRSWYWVYFD
jgi:hypothetical protein